MKQSGQAMILGLVVLPLFVLLTGLLVRSGMLVVVHHRLQAHCHKKVLDALSYQGQGLQELGKFNEPARRIINMRRQLQAELLAAPNPASAATLGSAIAKLRLAQEAIAIQQKAITTYELVQSARVLNEPPTAKDVGKDNETFGPANIVGTHASKKTLTLHVQAEPAYKGEVGAPLQPDDDFDRRQIATGKITFHPDDYLEKWPLLPRLPLVELKCQANIHMNILEDKWVARLSQVPDKLH